MREYRSVFCANADCVLHVSPGDANVEGGGNWASTADGLITGRQRIESRMLCDRCVARMRRGELFLPVAAA